MTAEDPDRTLSSPIESVLVEMQARIDRLPDRLAHQRVFLSTYRRMTRSVGTAVADGLFEDAEWVHRWDVSFVDFYLRALDGETAGGDGVPEPWRRAFRAPSDLPPLRHVLLGINAHINYDLPQALLAIISDEDFDDATVMALRRRDHQRVDTVLSSQVASESNELAGPDGLSVLDRVLRPLNRKGSQRFLREARAKVWHNSQQLHLARMDGPAALAGRLAELETLAADKVTDLLRPGQVLLRLTFTGFGVRLSTPPNPPADRDARH